MTIGQVNADNATQTTSVNTNQGNNTPNTVTNNATNNRNVTEATNQSETQEQRTVTADSRNAFQKMVDSFCQKFGEFWSKVETSVENSRLFHGLQGVREAAVTTKEMTQEATANALGHEEQALQVRVERDMRLNRPIEKLSAETSYVLLNEYPNNEHRLNTSFLLKELANETPLAKVLTKQVDKEFASENLKFLDTLQKDFLIDVNVPLSRDSQNLDFSLGDTLGLHRDFINVNSRLQINISSRARDTFSQDVQNYLGALKDLELATRAQSEMNAVAIESTSISPAELNSKTPTVSDTDLAKLEAVDIKRSENLEQTDPLYAQKQALLDCKENLDTSFRAAANELSRLLNQSNSAVVTQLENNIRGTRFDPQANAALAPSVAPTVAPTPAASVSTNNDTSSAASLDTRISDLANTIDADTNQIAHTSTFSHSHMTLAHISKAADVIEPTNSLSVDGLSAPQNDDQLAISDDTQAANPIGRTHTYGNTLTVPGMADN